MFTGSNTVCATSLLGVQCHLIIVPEGHILEKEAKEEVIFLRFYCHHFQQTC